MEVIIMGNGKRFLIAKNELLKRYTGMDLIPEDQIVDDGKYDNLKLDIKESDSLICTYCHIHSLPHIPYDDEGKCKKCPMHIAGNNCDNPYSSYHNMIMFIINKYGDRKHIISRDLPWHDELVALVDEYNKNSKYEEKQNALFNTGSK